MAKPSILVPSPNVAEDHQTKNALALSEKDAAILIRDNEASEKLVSTAISIVEDATRLDTLSSDTFKLAYVDAAYKIFNILADAAK